MTASFPELRQSAEEISSHLAMLDLTEKADHRTALAYTFNAMKTAGLKFDRNLNETKKP